MNWQEPKGLWILTVSSLSGNIRLGLRIIHRSCLALILVWMAPVILAGCRTPGEYRVDVDRKTIGIITEKQAQTLGRKDPFTIEKSGETLRRHLIEQGLLPVSGPASLGSDKLPPADHWPEADYPEPAPQPSQPVTSKDIPLTLSLFQALEIGARNSFDFQTQKEAVFQAGLALYLEQDSFRNSFAGQIQSLFSSDASREPTRNGMLASGEFSGTRTFENGMSLTTALAVDLASLLTGGSGSSVGIAGTASLSIPLLRGSGRHIITEPLKQAEQNLLYALLAFERFKTEFAVSAGSNYLTILKQLDMVKNAQEDYKSRIVSARRSKRLADAGRIKEIEVDQSVQTELVARQRWVSAQVQYKKQMDAFKHLLGLPPDADILLDKGELSRLADLPGINTVSDDITGALESKITDALPADAPVQMPEPDTIHRGPLELSTRTAIELGLENRLDLKIAVGKVFDAQRAVVVAADTLGAELTFLGSASMGERRTITSADLENAKLRMDQGVFSGLLTLDLPFERSAEAVTYRNSFIKLEQAVRSVQRLEDTIKLDIRNRLRELLEARETLYIQAKAVSLALKRVKSITLFMDAGRAETRDLLEAQDALLAAQNSLTSARVNYRIAELEIQRDMGLLAVTDTGLWQEYSPEAHINGEK